MNDIPLLITSAAYPSAPVVAITDASERIKHTLEALRQWNRISPDLHIVICDGSGHDFTPEIDREPTLNASRIELLSFHNNEELVRSQGKGYGEGEIINYALANSRILRRYSHFAKCTAKLWVDNFAQCVAKYNQIISLDKIYYSSRSLAYSQCDTRFYLIRKDFYQEFFSNCHQHVDDCHEYYLEHAFADVLKTHKIRSSDCACQPLVFGYSGSLGHFQQTMPENWKRKIFRKVRRIFV